MKHFYYVLCVLLLIFSQNVDAKVLDIKIRYLNRLTASPIINGPDSVCSGGTVTLTVNYSGPGIIRWYDAPTGGALLFTGTSFITPALTATETFYAELTEGTAPPEMSEGKTVTVNPLPSVDFTFANNACAGTSVQFTSTVSNGNGPYTYSWDFGDGDTSTAANPTHTFESFGCATQNFTVKLKVKDGNNCESLVKEHIIMIKQRPDVNFKDGNASGGPSTYFNNCANAANNPVYNITVDNISINACSGTTYTVNWGDSPTSFPVTNFPITHTYNSLGAYSMVITATGLNGCVTKKTYIIKNVYNPSGGINSPGNTQNLCVPTSLIQFTISNWATNAPGTTYNIDYGDGSTPLNLTQEQLVASPHYNASNPAASANYPVPYSYSNTSCPNNEFTVKLTVTNACAFTTGTIANISTIAKPVPNFSSPEYACVNTSVTFTNITVLGYEAGCTRDTKFTWNFGDGTPNVIVDYTTSTPNITHTFSTPGNYTVTLTTQNSCGTSIKTKTICIEPATTAAFTLSGNEGCAPFEVQTTNTTNLTDLCSPTYQWTVSYSAANCGTNPGSSYNYFIGGTNSTSANPKFNFPNAGTYTITLKVLTSCNAATQTITKTVTVKQKPTVNITSTSSVCSGANLSPSANVSNCTSQSVSYLWTFNGGTPATSTSLNPGPVSFSSGGSHSITLEVTNECGTTTASQTVNVATAPTVNPVTNIERCQGISVPATSFSSPESGVTYQWTNSNTAIGLAASGNGNLPSFTAVNNTNVPIVSTITVKASKGGCTGPTQTFTITVQPLATITSATPNITLCNGATHPGTSFTGTAGATYTWTNSNASIGLLATGPTAIPSFTATNTGTTPVTATITVTPTINGCAGTPKTFTITVNPTPQALTLTDKILCHSQPSGEITFSNAVSGTTYTWTNSNPAIGLAASGSGNISFNATNTGAAPITATITVTGTANGCSAAAQTFTITVNPSPVVTFSMANQTICTETQSQPVTLQSTTSGVDFSWTAVAPPGVTGVVTSGTNTIPAQNLVNNTNAPLTVTYKAKAALTGTTPCPGAEFNYTITVKPKAANISGLPTTICSGATFSITPVNGSGNIVPAGTTYTWADPVITPAGSVNGASAQAVQQTSISQLLNNTTNSQATVAYTITPVSDGCLGNPFTVEIRVNPVPDVNAIANVTVCNGQLATPDIFSGNVTGVTYDWVATGGNIGMVSSSGTGNVPAFNAVNTTNNPITVTITVTPKIGNCSGPSKTFTIRVNPAPTTAFSIADQAVCSGGTTLPVTLTSTTSGATFTWTADAPTGITGIVSSGTNTIPAQILQNTTTAPVVVTYTAKAATSTGTACPGPNAEYKITVHPLPTISTQPVPQQEVCVGGTLNALTVGYTGGHGTPAYQWYSNTTVSTTGASIITGATSSSYTPPTNTVGTLYYYAIITLSGNGCGTATSDFAMITVVPDPTITNPAFTPQTLCAGASAQSLSVTASGGSDSPNYIYQWYVSNTNSTSAGTLIAGENTSTFTPPVPAQVTTAQTKYYYCEVKTAVSGCSVFSSVAEVKVIPAPAFTSQPLTANVCHLQTPSALTVAYVNGTGTPTYQWFENSTNSIAGATAIPGANSPAYQPQGTTVGTTYYFATVTFSSGGCQVITSAIAAITINPLTEVTSTETATICSGQQFTVSPVHGGGNNVPAGTTYTWAAPVPAIAGGSAQSAPQSSISQVLTNSTILPVTVTYTVTPAYNGCTGNPFTVTVTVNPKATIANTTATICSGGTFTIDPITIAGASIPSATTYSWSAPVVTGGLTGGAAGTGETIVTGTLTNPTTTTQTATYTVTPLSQPGNCNGQPFDIVVTVKPQISVTSVLSDFNGFEISTAGGSDGAIDLTVTGGSGSYSYSWVGPNGFAATTQDLTGLSVGVYTVTVTDGLCNAVVVPFNVREPMPLVIQEVIASHVNVNCFGQLTGVIEVEITQPSIAPFDYQIILQGGGVVEAVNNLTALNYVFDNLAAGTYDIKVTDANGTVKTLTGIVVTQPASGLAISNATVSNHNGFSITCNGANDGSIDLTITGGYPVYTYAWTGPNGFTAATPTISNLSPGTYTVAIGDATNVCTITQNYTITEPQPVTFTGIKSDYNGFGVSCSGGSNGTINITPAGGAGAYIYQWTGPNGFSASSQNLTGLFAGTYTLNLSDSNGCVATQEVYTLTEPLSMTITETHTNLLCHGASTGTVSVNVSGGVPGASGYIYSWSGPNSFSAATQNLANVMAGTYILTVTDASGCSATISVTLTQPSEITIIPTQTPISCYGANDASLSLAISGGVGTYQVTWDNFASGTFQDNLAAGTYVITVKDSNNCSKVISVIIPEAPIFTINPAHTNISCHGANDGSIVLNLVGGQAPVSLVWNDDPTAGNARFNLPAGTYTVTITDSKPCVITRSFIIVEPQPLTLGGVVTNADNCTNTMSGAINLLPAGGSPPFTFSWSNGATTEDLTGITSGNYAVTVTDSRGCSVSRQFQVTRPLPLEVTVTSNVDFNCTTKYVMQTNTATASGGIPPYLYSWSSGTVSGQGGRSMTTNQNGSVTVTVTDLKGCTAIHTFGVDTQQLGDISHTITSYGFETYGLYSIIDPIEFTNTSTGDFTSVSWNFGDGSVSDEESPTHSYQREGTYVVTQTVVYPYGCISRKTITLTVEKGYNVMIPNGFTPNADGINDTFNAQHTGLKSIQLEVYDTWGSMIYSEKGETLRGWDGNVKGVPAENGNFYYRMKVETFYGNIANYEGPLVLIK
ncbi:PKD domain-containing protein [Flavobacterium sp. J372]|uniref:PKD-like domain-containing protein n=1 Tax=Flavobacterium sp. J372 TaxID=2898436 RepID=UPI0021514274|nr:PKD-like domain-containing protein [Flavobacterium sp. J372]MCR5861004.1 PKD domain-containing protein [Flavobacterium sp. J372]